MLENKEADLRRKLRKTYEYLGLMERDLGALAEIIGIEPDDLTEEVGKGEKKDA